VAGRAGVQRGRLHAVVEGEANHHHPLDPLLAEEVGQLRVPARVAVQLTLAALEHLEVGLHAQVRVRLPAGGALHAVGRPGTALLDEGRVVGRVAVVGGDHGGEPRREPVDDRHDLVALGDGEAAARAEVALHVDHDQRVVVLWCEGHRMLLGCVDGVPALLAACTTT
jgi:multidrug efflux pump subunit AcrA (membrane-fusion protein)